MKTYNIFVSHAWRYSEHYYKVMSWLEEAKQDGLFDYKSYSVPIHDPLIDPNTSIGQQELQRLLDAQIKPASIVIILAGMYATYSDWITFEINTSVKYSKNIIGVKPWGQERIPQIVSINSNKLVGWNKHSIINAILEY
ncbi:TIR domain-containing protein [Lachnospiraceae bacterium 46-61]